MSHLSLPAILATGLLLLSEVAFAQCIRDHQPVAGELREVRTTDPTGQLVASFHVVLASPVCVEVEPGQGSEDEAPRVIDDVRSIEIVLAMPAESLELAGLLGAEVEVRGQFEAPVETVHTGDAVLLDANLATIEGAEPRSAETIQPDGALESKIERFVRGFYLSGEDVEEEQIRLLYAPFVHYFGKDDVAVAEIVRDKRGYYQRWPRRVFSLIEGTLDVRRLEGTGQLYDVAFEYDFEVRRTGEERRGRGVAVLTIDLDEQDGRIVRETGRVLQRF